MATRSALTFGLPPSLGRESVRERALAFADLLYDAGFGTVVPSRDYDHLEDMLRTGEADAAWGPPLVCARVERDGGRVILRAVRDGQASYRAAVVCRAEDALSSIDDLKHPPRPLRATWVDQRSIAGYLSPLAMLRERGIDPDQAFYAQATTGSYSRCLADVAGHTADVTGTFAPARQPANSSAEVDGLVNLGGRRRGEFRVLAYSPEYPNDGFVLSPALEGPRGDAIQRLLEHVLSRASHMLADTFNADTFDRPMPGAYAGVLDLVAP